MPTKTTKKPAAKKAAKPASPHASSRGGKPAVKKAAPHKAAVHKAVHAKPTVTHDAKPHVVVAAVVPDAIKREEYMSSVGKRKTAIARVRYYKLGTGEMQVNGMTLEKYFGYTPWVDEAKGSLAATGWAQGRWSIKVQGGGKHAQAHAIRHGIARLLILLDPALRAVIKPHGFLTRDARVKERKKYGLKRARRAPQWQKR